MVRFEVLGSREDCLVLILGRCWDGMVVFLGRCDIVWLIRLGSTRLKGGQGNMELNEPKYEKNSGDV